MAIVRKTTTLTEQPNDWIAAQIDAGHYTNDRKAIPDLIRREQDCSADLARLRAALIDGEESGAPEPFDIAAFAPRHTSQRG